MSSQGPLVSILMNCYNGEAFLCEAIDSVLKQSYQNWEIIFWDNASTDHTAELVRKYTDARIKYFRGDKNVQLYHARNFALDKCTGEFIAFLDIDDLWRSDKLEKQIPLFQNTKVGIVFSDTYFLKDGEIICRFFESKTPYRGSRFKELIKNYFLSLETVIVRKKCFDDWKEKFDERFNHIGDLEMFTRMAYYWEVDYIDEPLGVWRVHANNLSFKNQKGFFEETELMIEKYKKIIPNFEVNHQSELYELNKQVAVWKSKLSLLKSDRKSSLKAIKPYLLTLKGSLLGILVLLPFSISHRILNKRNFT